MESYFLRSELYRNGMWRQKERIEIDVLRRMSMSDEELAVEDWERLDTSHLKFPPVHSLEVFYSHYGSFVRGMMKKFGVWSFHRQEDRWGDLLLRAAETRHFRRYVHLLVRQIPDQPPKRREKEKDEAYAKKLKAFEDIPPEIRGKFKVSRPSFQTHIYTLTQSVCVNGGNKDRREPSSGGISLDYSAEGDDEKGSLIDVLAPVLSKEELRIDLLEVLDSFEGHLVSKYRTRKLKTGEVVDWWGPEIEMTRLWVHSEDSPVAAVEDGVELMFGVKGQLVPKQVGVPVRDRMGEMQYESTGEVIHRSYAEVFRLLRQGYRQTDIARILKVSTGSPGNWVARLRDDFKKFIDARKISKEMVVGA